MTKPREKEVKASRLTAVINCRDGYERDDDNSPYQSPNQPLVTLWKGTERKNYTLLQLIYIYSPFSFSMIKLALDDPLKKKEAYI